MRKSTTAVSFPQLFRLPCVYVDVDHSRHPAPDIVELFEPLGRTLRSLVARVDSLSAVGDDASDAQLRLLRLRTTEALLTLRSVTDAVGFPSGGDGRAGQGDRPHLRLVTAAVPLERPRSKRTGRSR